MSKVKGKKSHIFSPFDAAPLKTKRTANQKFAEWINQIIKDKHLPMGIAEQETVGADRKQPNIVIYKSPHSVDVLCVIELKHPYFDLFDFKELKKPVWEKAVQRKQNISDVQTSTDSSGIRQKKLIDKLMSQSRLRGYMTFLQ